MPVAERRQLLDQRRLVDAEVDASGAGGVVETCHGIEAGDPRAAAADVRFDHDREPQSTRGLRCHRSVVDHPRFGIRQTQLLEDVELQRFRRLHLVAGRAINHRNTDPLQMPEPAFGVKRYLTMAAQICRRTRAIEYQRVRRLRLGRIIGMRGCIHALVRDRATIELGEQRSEPVGVLVVNRNRSIGCCRHLVLGALILVEHKAASLGVFKLSSGPRRSSRSVGKAAGRSYQRAQDWLSISAWTSGIPAA